jgi:hypothetical protein
MSFWFNPIFESFALSNSKTNCPGALLELEKTFFAHLTQIKYFSKSSEIFFNNSKFFAEFTTNFTQTAAHPGGHHLSAATSNSKPSHFKYLNLSSKTFSNSLAFNSQLLFLSLLSVKSR